MRVEIQIDDDCAEPVVVIRTKRMTDAIQALALKLSLDAPRLLAGQRDGVFTLLEESDIQRVYAAGGKVYARTDSGEYALRQRLYELEELFDASRFVRISNSEIINLKKVRGFDLSLAGTIRVTLADGTTTYVSRRCVARVKRALGL